MNKSKTAIVIGAGVAGLAVSIRLAHKGYQVTTFDANAYPGGKLCEIRQDGYRWDAGPSLFTLPEYVKELFTLTGRDSADYITYVKLDPLAHYFWPDGTQLIAPATPEAMASAVQQATGEPSTHVRAHLNKAAQIDSITHFTFLQNSLHKFGTYFNRHTVSAITQLGRIDAFRTMHQANAARFTDPRIVQLFNRYATYNGSDPYRAPATLNVIPHLEFNQGAYFPTGGMIAITNGLFQLAKDVGVTFRLGEPVDRVWVKNKRAVGIRTGKGDVSSDIVVSNADVSLTYRKLMPDQPAPERLLAQEKSTSGLIFYWGVQKAFPKLALHNVFFSADYKLEFDTLFIDKRIPRDPTIYLNITSKYKPDDAPAGCENWFVMINTPPDDGTGGMPWQEMIAEARRRILGKLGSRLGTAIGPLIQTEAILAPQDIEARTSSLGGSLYGNASNSIMAAFLRHANFSRRIKGLYFCGGSVHPGGGIPLCLLSAKITAGLLPAC